jgi:hypothetical protein
LGVFINNKANVTVTTALIIGRQYCSYDADDGIIVAAGGESKPVSGRRKPVVTERG